jgi:hypothetical protein
MNMVAISAAIPRINGECWTGKGPSSSTKHTGGGKSPAMGSGPGRLFKRSGSC